MVGSLEEAEDLVQEAMLRAWRYRSSFRRRASVRTWLYKIATNLCLDVLGRRARRSLPQATHAPSDPRSPVQAPTEEPVWLEPYPDSWLPDASASPEARYTSLESVSLAFMVTLQALPARQRAVLLLREVLDWRATEVAEVIETTVPAVNSMLHRARSKLRHDYGSEHLLSTVGELDSKIQAALDRYVDAWQSDDVSGLVELLTEDALLAMPPSPTWVKGRDRVHVFLDNYVFEGDAKNRWRMIPTAANGQPAFGLYRRDASSGPYQTVGIKVLALERAETGVEVSAITYFISPQLAARFGLPNTLDG